MYYVKKTVELSASHLLALNYESKCTNTHGHNWLITLYCKAAKLNENGMVTDFSVLKDTVMYFDHKHLNDYFTFNPTAENMAKYFCDKIDCCYKVEIQESIGNVATYEKE